MPLSSLWCHRYDILASAQYGGKYQSFEVRNLTVVALSLPSVRTFADTEMTKTESNIFMRLSLEMWINENRCSGTCKTWHRCFVRVDILKKFFLKTHQRNAQITLHTTWVKYEASSVGILAPWLLALCDGNPPVDSPHNGPVMQVFDVSFVGKK